MNEDDPDQTRGAMGNRVASEGMQKTERRLWMPWIVRTEDEFETKNTRSEVSKIKIREHWNSTLQRTNMRVRKIHGSCVDIMDVTLRRRTDRVIRQTMLSCSGTRSTVCTSGATALGRDDMSAGLGHKVAKCAI